MLESASATMVHYSELMRLVSFTLPLTQWITDGVTFKFWGDNVDKKRGVRDVRSDHQKSMVHMYSILAGRSHLSYTEFLPTQHDVERVLIWWGL